MADGGFAMALARFGISVRGRVMRHSLTVITGIIFVLAMLVIMAMGASSYTSNIGGIKQSLSDVPFSNGTQDGGKWIVGVATVASFLLSWFTGQLIFSSRVAARYEGRLASVKASKSVSILARAVEELLTHHETLDNQATSGQYSEVGPTPAKPGGDDLPVVADLDDYDVETGTAPAPQAWARTNGTPNAISGRDFGAISQRLRHALRNIVLTKESRAMAMRDARGQRHTAMDWVFVLVLNFCCLLVGSIVMYGNNRDLFLGFFAGFSIPLMWRFIYVLVLAFSHFCDGPPPPIVIDNFDGQDELLIPPSSSTDFNPAQS